MEIWKDIKNYEGLYQVSNYGRVKSLGHKIEAKIKYNEFRVTKGKILKLNQKRNIIIKQNYGMKNFHQENIDKIKKK